MKKQTFIIIGLFLAVFTGTNWLNAQTTYIQVAAEPGVSVFLDNQFKGKTTADIGGLIIENVTPGSRLIRVVKDGFNPQEDRITVNAGEVYTHRVRPFVPKIKIEQKGSEGEQKIDLQVGRIKIQSLPVAINISIPSLGVNSAKTQDEWMANEISAGTYEATFAWQGKLLRHSIDVKQNQETHLFVNMLQLKVELRASTKAPSTSKVKHDAVSVVYGNFTDPRDGKTYKTVKIGNQTWMAENLNFNTGSGSWCYNNNSSFCAIYGRLYDWETARKACPPGWHLPSDSEWTQLTNLLGGENVAGGKLKATTLWNSPNANADNSSEFSALPGGFRSTDGSFIYRVGYHGYWWSSTETWSTDAWSRFMHYNHSKVHRENNSKTGGFSVRCLRD